MPRRRSLRYPGAASLQARSSRSDGNSTIQSSAIATVPMPLITAAGTVPNSAAVTPLSYSPS